MSKAKKETSEEQELTAILTDKETGEEYAFKGRGSYWKEGADWGGSVNLTTNKAEAVVFELARYVATVEPGAPGVAEARRILHLIYQKLSSFTIGLQEDGETFFCSWMAKDGLRKDAVDTEVDEALKAEIFKAFVLRVFMPEKLESLQKPAEIERGGEGIRASSSWATARYEIRRAGKVARRMTAEEFKMEIVLGKLLRDYSEHRDKDHPLYLLGNKGEAFVDGARVAIEGQITSEDMRIAVLEIPQAALYTAYTGKKAAAISTPERRRVDGILEAMQSDIVKVISTQKTEKGKIKRVEVERAKITVDRVFVDLTDEENAARDMGGVLPDGKMLIRIKFHPGFSIDIARRYTLLPDDILQRLERAVGGGRSSTKYYLLNEHLNLARSLGSVINKKPQRRDFDTLVTALDLETFKKKQGAKATEAEIDEAARVAKDIGLVLDWSKEPGEKGQKQWQFQINMDWGGAKKSLDSTVV